MAVVTLGAVMALAQSPAIMAAMTPAAQTAAAKTNPLNAKLTAVLNQYLPGTSGFGAVRVDKVNVNDKKKTVSIDCNENTAYIPFTKASYPGFVDAMKSALGGKYKNYKVNIYTVSYEKGKEAGRQNLSDLVLFADKTVKGPKEKGGFIKNLGAQPAPKGLDNANIALWQSHGWYYEPKLDRWEWQRARIFQTVEDLFTQSYVMPYLMPMLQNAGAYVMSPRERDTNLNEVIVDNDGNLSTGVYSENGGWSKAKTVGFGYTKKELHEGDNPFTEGTARVAKTTKHADKAAAATWTADIPEAGKYAVYVSYASLPNSAPDAVYTITDKAGAHQFRVNQKMGGGTWIYLGHFDFDKGTPAQPIVELKATSGHKNTVVSADAVKIGGGLSNVARRIKAGEDGQEYEYVTTDYPKYVQGARYFLQWAGAPDSVYTPSGNENDYNDDYRSRGLWVNWLAGGSSMVPDQPGLKIPVDLSFAWHSDAGTTMNDSIIGTLGIYCTRGDKYANGSDRLASRDYTDLVVTNIVDDIRAKYEPNWTRRGMWDQSYFEARVPEVPAMLLEFLSHQNFADMKYGLDPDFRFTVSRAVYKGMLEFLANRDGREYVVTPLAPNSFAINATGDNEYKLSWKATVDSLEETAVSDYYLIEERVGNGAFKQIAKVSDPEYKVKVSDGEIHSYRIIAGNDGGVSFPTEVLALCSTPNAKGMVEIVNGFTRVSAPDWFDAGNIAGFYDAKDHGVPDKEDISFIGSMFEYRRDIPWMDDDAAGFGGSRSNYEKDVIAGNTRDYVYLHGNTVRAAGYSFVSSSVEAFMNAGEDVQTPKLVDLILGKQKEIARGRGAYGTYYKTFPEKLQERLTALTKGGTSVFVSGSFVATDLWDNPHSSKEVAERDQKFATEVLGYHWRVGQASVTGEAYEVQSPFKQFNGGKFKFFNTLNKDSYAVESPDSFYPSDPKKGATIMRYSENGLVAGTAFDNDGLYKTVIMGFPFESIGCGNCRAKLMKQVLEFLDK